MPNKKTITYFINYPKKKKPKNPINQLKNSKIKKNK